MLRTLFSTTQPEKILPIEQIKQYISPDSIMAFNLGTEGVEKKITILGVNTKTNNLFFIKYATKPIAARNVLNESIVLQQLSHLPFVPKLQLSVRQENCFTLIKTTVLQGAKMKQQPSDEQMLTILFTLSAQQLKSNREYDSDLRTCFAHGDFCPWNMLINDGNIGIYDWEMAGQYPLGYDLFTCIFQFEFLVSEKLRFNQILKENANLIQHYFSYFQITNWKPYLHKFSELKYLLESEKHNDDLIDSYFQLEKYVANL
ncbi:MAG: aminoglycoside phosphotransferase family protein [Bacteroidota bacterium]|nr:aminoglycoside phosphotransferase family protein [Bacteroidota bacterium]